MAITIKKVTTKKELEIFATFDHQLYKDNKAFVPSLIDEELKLLDKSKNAAFEFCEADYFLAYKENKVVGRIAGIINHRYNEIWNDNSARFGFVDFIDDAEVSNKLFETVEQWAKERGKAAIVGPLGFTDLDKEGLLVEGFEEISTMSALYNASYYKDHIEQLGYQRDADWIEFKIFVPEEVPEKHQRISEIVKKKFNLRVLKYSSSRKLMKEYGQAIFDLVNECYSGLYGFVPLTEKQIKQYISQYLPFLNLNFVTLIVDQDDKLVCLGIAMPSLSKALQKSGGKLFPFGFIHLLKAMYSKKCEVIDLLLVAVKPEYQNKGVNALLFADLIPCFIKAGVKYGESNPELEHNERVQAQWDYFPTQQHKRRRAYRKQLK